MQIEKVDYNYYLYTENNTKNYINLMLYWSKTLIFVFLKIIL